MAQRIDAERVREFMAAGAQIVEVLPEAEYADEHLPGAINIPLKRLDAQTAAQLDRSNPVVVYCWDALWDLSPRAACRLETLGFPDVHDYWAGKADWLARGWPREGETAGETRAGDLARGDVVATCDLDARVGDVRERVQASPYGFALVLGPDRTLLGRLRRAVLEGDPDAVAQDVMEPGPSTIRFDQSLDSVRERMGRLDLRTLPVTTPEGRLLGVVRREDVG